MHTIQNIKVKLRSNVFTQTVDISYNLIMIYLDIRLHDDGMGHHSI